jgi:hypothetical protein
MASQYSKNFPGRTPLTCVNNHVSEGREDTWEQTYATLQAVIRRPAVRRDGVAARHNLSLQFNAEESSMSTLPTTPNIPETRSDNLFPADADDSGADGRFDVAEEVSLDQQTDSSRKVGQVQDEAAAKALAESIEEKSQTGV